MRLLHRAGFAGIAGLACCATLAAAQPQQSPASNDGKLILHKFEQPIGQEHYTIERSDTEVDTASTFEFTDRGTKVALTARLKTSLNFLPRSFSIQGDVARDTPIDASAEVSGDKIRVRLEKDTKDSERPKSFFFIAGYAPAAMQMMLLRYWEANGRPATLVTFPAGKLSIEDRGSDQFLVSGETMALERFSIAGLTWGRETVWLDAEKNLAALVSVDAEYDHFEAIRPDYEPALGEFVKRSASDAMAALAEISKNFRSTPGHETIALEGANLIDGTGKAAIPNSVVLVKDGRILAAGPRSSVHIPSGAQKIDVRGKTIIPGLWDMHAHFEQVEWGPVYLAAGVTTVRDVGNEFEYITAVRDAIAGGRGVGPRLLLAGVVDGSGPLGLGVARVDNAAQAHEWVDRYHDAGFAQMKIYSSVKKENVVAIAAEAHRLGMTVTGHVPIGMNAYDAVDSGFDQINHLTYILDVMDPDLQALRRSGKPQEVLDNLRGFDANSPAAQKAVMFFKEHHTVIDPTMAIFEMVFRTGKKPLINFEPGVAKVAPPLAEQLKNVGSHSENPDALEAMFNALLKVLRSLHQAGIPVVVGTDQTVPGHSVHREMEIYVEAGFTPMEALEAATLVPARAMHVEQETGTVEAGKRADLVILGASPLENISNVRKTERVMQGGVLYDCASLWKSVDFLP